MRFQRSEPQTKEPQTPVIKKNASEEVKQGDFLGVPDGEEAKSNRLSNLKFSKTGENSIPIIHNEEYQAQKLEVVNILGAD